MPARLTVPALPATGSGAVDAARALLIALARLGLRDLVLAPGSRSAPLVYAAQLAAATVPELRCHVRLDERAAAFTALGMGKADPTRPAAVITTSGTATAHLLAAVMEAHHARTPLIVLTADRPAELRDTGANQATRQSGLLRDFCGLTADLPAPTAYRAEHAELLTAVNVAARAHAHALAGAPVHLNLGFRDPLVPATSPVDGEDLPALTITRRLTAPAHPDRAALTLGRGPRTVMIAGDGAGPAAAVLAEQADWPLIAEPSSGARTGASLVPDGVGLLRRALAGAGDEDGALLPDRAVVVGRVTLSRPVVSGLLGRDEIETVLVSDDLDWPDAARRLDVVADSVALAPAGEDAAGAEAAFSARWRDAAARPAGAAPPAPAAGQELDRITAALSVWEAGKTDDLLYLGSSSVSRILERHAGPQRARVIAHRGLAGIDGTLSAGAGAALVHGRGRVRVLVGDLTALHDLTGLVVGPLEQRPALDVIVLDDDGGAIFGDLEHAAADPADFERFFGTPHGTDLVAIARGAGWDARTVTSVTELQALLSAPGDRRLLRIACRRDRALS